MTITNEKLKTYRFLREMSEDSYFPPFLVDNAQHILIRLCERIEAEGPKDLKALYALTHAATVEFNELENEFNENDSEIETAARDCIGTDFGFIAEAYGFDADNEELIAPRNW